MPSRRTLLLCMTFALVLPVLVSVGHECFAPLSWGPAGGDFAVLELHLRDVARFRHWLGPYSRFKWNHPGPFYYWLLSPLYWASGAATASLYASAALMALVAVVGSIATFLGERRAHLERLVFLLFFGGIVLGFCAGRLPGDPWNPVVTVLPFAWLYLLCATIASNGLRWLPGAVLLHAFLVQTHISHLPCSSALLGTSIVLGWRRGAVADTRGRRRALVLGAVAFSLAWLPSLIAEWMPGPSNMGAIFRHFTAAREEPNSLRFALTYGSTKLHSWLLRPLHLDADVELAVALTLSGLQTLLLVGAALRARSRRAHPDFARCVLALVATLASYLCCRQLGKVTTHHDYLTLWFPVVGMFNGLAIALAWLSEVRSGEGARRVEYAATVVVALGLGSLSLLVTRSVSNRYASLAQRPRDAVEHLSALTDRVESLLRQNGADYVLRTDAGRPWPLLAGVLLGLDKRGISATVEPRWRFMFGNGRSYAQAGSTLPSLIIGKRESHTERLLGDFGGGIYLYSEAPSEEPRAEIEVAANGATGDAGWVIDGAIPPEGAPASSPRVLSLDGPSASLSLALPGLRLNDVQAVLEGSAAYLLEGAEDGQNFVRIADVPATKPGLWRRQIPLPPAGYWRALRFSPLGAEGPFAIAEVLIDASSWGMSCLGALGTRGDVRWVTDGNRLAPGARWSSNGALVLAVEGAFVSLRLPDMSGQDARVDGIRITADANDDYRVSGSYGGESFELIGVSKSVKGKGLQTRDFIFDDGRSWSVVKLAPTQGDGRFSLAEVAPRVAPGRRIDLRSGGAEVSLLEGWETDPLGRGARATGRRSRLQLSLQPLRVYEATFMLDVAGPKAATIDAALYVDDRQVGHFHLSKERHTYGIDVPLDLARRNTPLDFVFTADATAAGEPSAVRLQSFWVTPSTGPESQNVRALRAP